MLLEKVAHFNDLSPEMRDKLVEKVKSFGKVVRYRFDIAKPNPDKEKFNGSEIYPQTYTLDPAVFDMVDPNDKRPGVSRSKKIALVDGTDEKGIPNRFLKIRVHGRDKGVFTIPLEDENGVEIIDGVSKAMFLELHPKHDGGVNHTSSQHKLFKRIDEEAYATQQRTERSLKLKALNVISDMSEKDVKDFCDAMGWDSTRGEIELRNDMENLAEADAKFFNDLIEKGSVEYRAAFKQALNKSVVSYDPVTQNVTWFGSQEVIVKLTIPADKTEIEAMGDWLQTGGARASEIYKKMKSLSGKKEPATSK